MKKASIFDKIRDLCWNEWNPIGIDRQGIDDDEYDSYIGGFLTLLRNKNNPEDELVEYLNWVEERMGMSGISGEAKLAKIARKMIQEYDNHKI